MGKEYLRDITVIGLVPSLGPVILFDDMEDLLKWVGSGDGADFACEKSQAAVYNKDYSLHLATKTTNPTTLDEVTGKRRLYGRPGKRYRAEFLFQYSAAAVENIIGCEANIFDGADAHKCGIRYGVAAERWYYLNSAGSWAELTGLTVVPDPACYHRLLVEWDEHTGKYIRVVFDSFVLDMKAISYRKYASPGALWFDFFFYVQTYAAAVGHGYFDDLLIVEI